MTADLDWWLYVTIDPPLTVEAGDLSSIGGGQLVARRGDTVVTTRYITNEQKGEVA